MLKKNGIIIAIVVILILFLGGGVFLLSRKSAPAVRPNIQSPSDQVVTLKPEDIGLTLSKTIYTKGNSSGPALRMEITKLDGVKSIDCEIHYSHATDTGDRTTEGLLCTIEVKPGTSTVKQDFPFATCSDVCHFQKDVSDVEAIIKIMKSDGKTYQVDQKFDYKASQ